MSHRHIIFVPGKNPKPRPVEHRKLLWRTLLEGVRRADPALLEALSQYGDDFHLVAWNYLYYREVKDISRDLPWVDALINQHGPTAQDILEARSWHRKLSRMLFAMADLVPVTIYLLPRVLRGTARETRRYFQNRENIASKIRQRLKDVLRPLLADHARILVIGHSLGSIIAYDALWELAHVEHRPGRIDVLLTLGSPLGMRYVQRRLMGAEQKGEQRYPPNIRHWVNLSSVGDVTALDRVCRDDFHEMLDLGVIDSIDDRFEGIYNHFRNEEGLNCHRSYGYLVNPAVGRIIADWWRSAD